MEAHQIFNRCRGAISIATFQSNLGLKMVAVATSPDSLSNQKKKRKESQIVHLHPYRSTNPQSWKFDEDQSGTF